MRTVVIFLLMSVMSISLARSQEVYNNCNSALELCPNQVFNVNNIGANATFCNDCEDDFNFCFSAENSVWFTFTTNSSGGDVQIDITSIVYQTVAGQGVNLQATIIQAVVPCDASTYTAIGNCINNGAGAMTLNATTLPANSTFFVVVDGDDAGGTLNPAEATFAVSISGTAIDRPTPSLNLTQSSANVCLNEIVQFIVSPVDCPNSDSYNWYVNGTLVAVTSDTTYQTASLQDGDLVSVETDCYSYCTVSVSNNYIPINVYSFSVDAGANQTIEEGQSVQLNGSTTAPNFVWTPAFYLSADNILDPVATPDETVTYTLTATENGCTLFDYVTVTVNSGLHVPNTFSPNGDSNNDLWIIDGIDQYPNCLVQIFTRWGQRIYQASGYSDLKAWDGTNGKGEVTEGVYYYVLELRDGSGDILKGSVTVLR